MRFRLFILLFFVSCISFATHNRAGYINYCWVGGTNYHIRIYTYTNFNTGVGGNTGSDRCEQMLYIDGDQDSVMCYRTNSTDACPNGGIPPGFDGQIIIPFFSAGNVKLNIYEGTIIGLNIGTHVLTMIDPNRDANIINLPNSVNRSFALISTISISNSFGNKTNCSPFITNKPIDYACVGKPYCFNPQAIDPDNDSLDFSFTKSYEGGGGNPGSVSMMNDEIVPSGITVNKYTGLLCWTSPQQTGEFVLALLIKEYRRNPLDGSVRLIGTTVLDIQILVQENCDGSIAMTIEPGQCVVAGTTYTNTITATKTGTSIMPPLKLTAYGLPLTSSTIGTNATFTDTPSGNTVTGIFSWTPDCRAVQVNNYYVTIQASDNNTVPYSSYSTFSVKVISPPPQNVVALSAGSNINLSWAPPSICNQTTGNIIQKYLVFRNDGCSPFIPSPCETGVPSNTGYVLIGVVTSTLSVTSFSFSDSNFGAGFPPGNTYSYIVVAQFVDGSLSIASSATSSTCVTTKLDVPLITNVSVDTTDNAVGQIFVRWKNPSTDLASGLDTTLFPGPYTYVLNRRPITTLTYTPIYTVTETDFYKLKKLQDTTFTDLLLDTKTLKYYYKIDFYTTNVAHGSSSPASSLFLTGAPHDKSVDLSWSAQVPWSNTMYYILKQHYSTQANPLAYDIIDSTTSTSYTVTTLVNGYSYCFKILSKGQYANPNIYRPLMNLSEKICVSPFDDDAPCQPTLSVAGNCSTSINKLVWTNPNNNCGTNDIVKYYIYYTAFQDSALALIDSLLNPNDTSYTTDFASSIAGCYVIVAVDSVGNKSPLNNKICTDNCPEYELPNIFTPNGDNLNDFYIPVKNKYIKDVDFTMYNRWGEIVFETSDPALKWDGKSKVMKQPVSDGTYYYICTVRQIHYYGIKERKLKGFVQVLH